MTEELVNDILSAARTQAHRLAQAELERRTPPLHAWRPRHAHRWLRVGAAFAVLGVVLASASWAWVRRARPSAPAATSPTVAPLEVPLSTARPSIAPPAEALRVAKRKRVTHVAPPDVVPTATEKAAIELEGPDEEVIFGRVPVKQAPLFTTEEYKARGVMVR